MYSFLEIWPDLLVSQIGRSELQSYSLLHSSFRVIQLQPYRECLSAVHIYPIKNLSLTFFFNLNFQSFSQLWSSKRKVIIIGDFNIHVDTENDSLGTEFLSLLD